MKKLIVATLLLGSGTLLSAQKTAKIPAYYKPAKSEMYHKGWIDFNKNGIKDIYEDPAATLDARIENLLQQMTLEEKTCQMVTLYGYKRVLKDALPTPEWKQMLWKDGIGAIDEHLNGFQQWGLPPSDNENVWPASRHAWALNEIQRFFVEDTRLGIPVDFTNEGIRGVESYKATNFPTQLGLGHTWNRELIRQVGLITGREARMLGYTNVYAPILDVGRDQRWGRYEEVYGESPYLVAELGIEMVRGLQHNHQVAATAKHFAAYSNNKGAREGMARVDPQMPPREVENIHIYPFKRVIREAGLLGVMSSYNDYDGIPIQGSYYWLTTRLRKEMGFRGYVVSDSDAVEYLYTKHNTAKDMKEAVRQSVEAGLNVRCTFRSPDSFVLPLRELVKEGGLSEEVINDRVRDILRVKFLIGLFDAPYQTDLAGADDEVEKEANEAVALQASRESIVLLKNTDNTLPLNIDKIKKIAVCGPNADEEGYALTHYGPLAVEVTTVLEGIREKAQGKAEVLYTKGCNLVDAHWPESEIMELPHIEDYQEGPWFYKRNEHYYLAFASTCCPEGIGYAMSKNPLGPWEYKGHIMDHTPRTRGNHPGIIDYKGKSYCFGQNYDIFRLETSRHAERRSVSVAEMEYNPNGTIRMLPYFHECKLEQIEKFNPYRKVEAETMAWGFGLKTTPKNIWSHERWNQLVTSIDDGEYLMVKGVDFGKGAKTFKVSASAHLYGGILEIHIDQKDGPCVGTVNISHTKSELREFTTSVVNLNGVHDLYFVFKGGKELKKNLFMLDWWAFE